MDANTASGGLPYNRGASSPIDACNARIRFGAAGKGRAASLGLDGVRGDGAGIGGARWVRLRKPDAQKASRLASAEIGASFARGSRALLGEAHSGRGYWGVLVADRDTGETALCAECGSFFYSRFECENFHDGARSGHAGARLSLSHHP